MCKLQVFWKLHKCFGNIRLGQPITGQVSNWLMFPKHLCSFQNTCTWSGPWHLPYILQKQNPIITKKESENAYLFFYISILPYIRIMRNNLLLRLSVSHSYGILFLKKAALKQWKWTGKRPPTRVLHHSTELLLLYLQMVASLERPRTDDCKKCNHCEELLFLLLAGGGHTPKGQKETLNETEKKIQIL